MTTKRSTKAGPRPAPTSTEVAPPRGVPMAATRPAGSATRRVKVEATKVGYYDHTRRRVGDVFTIDGTPAPAGHPRAGEPIAFSRAWMRVVDAATPESVTLPNAAIAREHDAILGQRLGLEGEGPATGDADPLGDGDPSADEE